jgi:hypothetical protein
MTRHRAPSAATIVALAVLGCAAHSPERPARVAVATAASRAELESIVTSAVGGRPVLLADDALTRDSVLIVERREPRDEQGRRVSGRGLDPPARFRLVLRASRCELVADADGRRWPLTQTRCVPAAPAP